MILFERRDFCFLLKAKGEGFRVLRFTGLAILLSACFQYSSVIAQPPNGGGVPEVVRIDENSIKPVMLPQGKPLLVNFWATWCVPCVEEFPLLVKIHEEYRGKIDFITISLDDLAEIKRDVPKFLNEQKAEMPAYLLYTPDENAVILAISKEWSGGLPFTILFGANGETLYAKQGIVKPDLLKPKIDGAIVVAGCKAPEEY